METKRTNLGLPSLLTLSGLILLTAGCELNEPKEQPDVPLLGGACFIERFIQPEAEITRSVDLLFVTDTSGSLNAERGQIASEIDSLVAELPDDVDYNIAVMLAHGEEMSGRLYQAADEPFVLSSLIMTEDEIRSALHYKLTHVQSEWETDGGEAGLVSLNRAMDASRMNEARNHGFFREDASLAVVFIADEQDICAEYPEGVTPVFDHDRLEGPAKEQYCTRTYDGQTETITPTLVYQKLKFVMEDRPLLIGAMVYNDVETVPSGGENEYGYGYIEAAEVSNGITVDLAADSYHVGLSEIGYLTSLKLNLVTEFTLARPEIDAETLSARVDGADVDWVYQEELNEVQIFDGGGALSVVDIEYCLKAEEPPVDDGDDDDGNGDDDDGGDTGGGDNGGGSGDDDPLCIGIGCGGGVIGV